MTTRRATDDSLHQNRYASNPEFERGLLATCIAKRVSVLDSKADRELIWALQYLSRQDGGLAAVVNEVLSKYPERIGTATMLQIGKAPTKNYSADEVRRIRSELPREFRCNFRLRGETKREFNRLLCHADRFAARLADQAEISEHLHSLAHCSFEELPKIDERRKVKRITQEAQDREEAAKFPDRYTVSELQKLCRNVAVEGQFDGHSSQSLERVLSDLCLDPSWELNSGRPWYFAGLVATLRDYLKQWIESKRNATVVTAIGKKIEDVLDFTWSSQSLSLAEGAARTGKSFGAKAWCGQHPGMARFVEVPPGNDESGFFRALSRGLGSGCSLNYKLGDLKERVESVLLTSDLVLVLDEGQRLWPTNLRHSYPHRINWVMAMVNAGVPICIITTPQFIQSQKVAEDHGWNGAQLTGRIGHYELLPTTLELDDLMAVGKSVLPEVSRDVLRALAAYARTSARYLAAVDSIAKRARYIAQRAGRDQCSTDDVRTAMKESVIPSDTRLVRTLEKTKSRRRLIAPVAETVPLPAPGESFEPVTQINRIAGANRMGNKILQSQ